MALSKISKILIQNSKKKVIYKAKTPWQLVIEKDFRFFIFFNILQFHGIFSCFAFFRLCTTAGGQLPHNKEMFVVIFLLFNRVELLCPVTTICLSFSFSRFTEFSCFRFFVCALGAAGSLITLKCLLLLFSFLIELDIMSCDFRPFFVCIVVQILHTVHHQVNSFRAGFLHMIFEFGFL